MVQYCTVVAKTKIKRHPGSCGNCGFRKTERQGIPIATQRHQDCRYGMLRWQLVLVLFFNCQRFLFVQKHSPVQGWFSAGPIHFQRRMLCPGGHASRLISRSERACPFNPVQGSGFIQFSTTAQSLLFNPQSGCSHALVSSSRSFVDGFGWMVVGWNLLLSVFAHCLCCPDAVFSLLLMAVCFC